MALQDFFVWGGSGQKLTPEQVERRREIEQAILAKGVDVSPVQDWTQGAARVADAIAGAFRRGRLDRADREISTVNRISSQPPQRWFCGSCIVLVYPDDVGCWRSGGNVSGVQQRCGFWRSARIVPRRRRHD
ncbi:hypothetical protein [Sinorhizobium psoraleae]|uniref:Uncharacterized protein n=1 Tax=Sinorhizobium psoraleae TaxID=520838 RepID=A0ABT4KM53_9HYPH|nr:hypothetical protein [Sinorhizobium psoraleae]MCZ4093050.1 hypothetical protein [Sinorhizobium psoraleae]